MKVYGKRHDAKPGFSLKLLLQYAIFAVYNLLLTKIVVLPVRKLLSRDISIASGYYTLLALLSAAILPVLLDWMRIFYKRGTDRLKNCLTLRNRKYRVVLCLLTVSIITLSLVPYYANLGEHQISIEALGRGNASRRGNEIKIDKIMIDGKSMEPETVLTQGGWFVAAEDGLFTWRDYDFPEGMERTAYGSFQAAQKMEVRFQANLWRGAAKVTVDGETQIVDCFFDSTVRNYQKTCTFAIRGYDRFKPILYLRNLLCMLLLFLLARKAVPLAKKLAARCCAVSEKKKGCRQARRKRDNSVRLKTDAAAKRTKRVHEADAGQLRKYFVIPAMSIVFLIHAYITFSERKLISTAAETTYELIPTFFYVRCVFLLVMLCLLLTVVFSKHLGIQNEDRMYYWLCIGTVLCSLCIRYPIKTWQAEPWWESCGNFLWQTYERGPGGSLLLDDSGYWTLLPRLISIVVLFLFKEIQYAPLITQFFVIALFVFINAKIVKREFSDYFSSEIRFVIALLLGTTPFISHLELLDLHNIGYYAIALMLLCCISDFEKVSWPVLLLDGVIAVLGCCSKLQGVVILPILIPVLIAGWRRMRSKERVFYCFCVAGCLMMVAYILSGVAEGRTLGNVETDTTVLLGATLKHVVQTFLVFIKPYQDGGYWAGCMINLAIVAVLMVCLYFCVCKFERRSVICFSLLAYMGGCALLMVLSYRLQFNGFQDFFEATSIYSDRNNFPLIFSALLFLLVFLSGHFISFSNGRLLLTLSLLVLVTRFSFMPVGLDACVNVKEELNWKAYSACLTKDTYGMPGLNGGFFLLKNAKVYSYGNKEPYKFDAHFFSGVSRSTPLEEEPVQTLSLEDTLSVVSVYTEKRYLPPEEEHIVLELRDGEGRVLKEVAAIGERDRYAIGFILEEPLDNVASLSFVDKDTGSEYFVDPNIYVVVEAPNRGMSADAGWGAISLEE